MEEWLLDAQERYKSVQVAENYDRVRFGHLRGRLYVALEKRALKRAFRHVHPGSTVVDLPCGTGRLAKFLLNWGYSVVGMDISPAMLHAAQERLAGYGDLFSTQVSNVFELGDEERQFDAALCARVLMHFPVAKQAEFLRGVASLTDGPIIFSQSFVTRYEGARQLVKRLLRVPGGARYPLTPDGLRTVLSAANLRLERKYWVAPPLSSAALFVCRKYEV